MSEVYRNPEMFDGTVDDYVKPPTDNSPDGTLHRFADSDEISPESISAAEAAALERAFQESPEIEQYRRGGVTVDSIRSVADFLRTSLAEKTIDEVETNEILAQADHFLDDITNFCHRYGSAVRSFRHSRLAHFHVDAEKQARILADKDRARRRTHEAMIDTFRAYNRYMSYTMYKEHGIRVPDTMLFPERIMNQREGVGNWALTTDYYLRASDLIESIKRKTGQDDEHPAPSRRVQGAD